jgi:hypothetical protein
MIVAICFIEGRKALLWIGGISQVGSAAGAIVLFLLVNVYEMFESAPACLPP